VEIASACDVLGWSPTVSIDDGPEMTACSLFEDEASRAG
jgi:hypothetical protein